MIKVDREKLALLVREQPDATLKERRDRLGVRCAQSTICSALKAIGMSFTKRRSTRPSRSGPLSPSAGPSGCSSVSARPSTN